MSLWRAIGAVLFSGMLSPVYRAATTTAECHAVVDDPRNDACARKATPIGEAESLAKRSRLKEPV